MITVEEGNKYDECMACSFDSEHKEQGVKKITFNSVTIPLCVVCREELIDKIGE